MARLTIKRFSNPDETRPFTDKGRAELLDFGDKAVARGVFEPGWKWSSHVKPLALTEQCEVNHELLVVSGRMHIRMADGEEVEIGPGDIATVPPGHDAWVLGDERCILLDFGDVRPYAQTKKEAQEPASAEEPA